MNFIRICIVFWISLNSNKLITTNKSRRLWCSNICFSRWCFIWKQSFFFCPGNCCYNTIRYKFGNHVSNWIFYFALSISQKSNLYVKTSFRLPQCRYWNVNSKFLIVVTVECCSVVFAIMLFNIINIRETAYSIAAMPRRIAIDLESGKLFCDLVKDNIWV